MHIYTLFVDNKLPIHANEDKNKYILIIRKKIEKGSTYNNTIIKE